MSIEDITQIGLDRNARAFALFKTPQFPEEPLPALDDGGDGILKALNRVIVGGECVADRNAPGIEGVRVLFPRIDDGKPRLPIPSERYFVIIALRPVRPSRPRLDVVRGGGRPVWLGIQSVEGLVLAVLPQGDGIAEVRCEQAGVSFRWGCSWGASALPSGFLAHR